MREWISSLLGATWEELSKEVIEASKMVLLDTIAAQIYGNQEAEIASYAKGMAEQENGSFRILGTPYRMSLHDAAFLNGCGSVATEMDEGNQWSKGHPAAHIVPTLLTYVQTRPGYTGKELLTVLIQGYEVCSRFGRATTLRPAAHAHGTWGVAGAAASALLMAGTTTDELLEGIKLSASFALPTMWSAALEGALVRNAYMGHAIQAGIQTVPLVRAGFRAPDNAVEYVFGEVLGSQFDASAFLPEASQTWDIERNYFKPYAFCRYVHAPIDAFAQMWDEHSLHVDEIQEIQIHTYSRAATLSSQEPHNVLSAKFSIPYAIAARMLAGRSDHRTFTPDLLQDQRILDMAKKVTVHASAELEKEYPTIMPAVVRIVKNDGSVLENRCDIAKGGPNRKLLAADIEKKFDALTSDVFSAERQQQIKRFVWEIETKTDMGQLIDLLTPDK